VYASGTGFGTNSGGVLNLLISIPEPSTYALWVGAVVLGCAVWRRARRQRALV
jgi:hypothetical protein